MTAAVKTAAKAIEQLEPREFEEFLVWLSHRVSARLGDADVPGRPPTAQERVGAHQASLEAGETEPFKYVDIERLPEPARKKAESIVAEWRAQYVS